VGVFFQQCLARTPTPNPSPQGGGRPACRPSLAPLPTKEREPRTQPKQRAGIAAGPLPSVTIAREELLRHVDVGVDGDLGVQGRGVDLIKQPVAELVDGR
jgi:hypothetical protein